MSKIEVNLNGAYSTGSVLIDGVDHANTITALRVNANVGSPTTVEVEHQFVDFVGAVDGKATHFVVMGKHEFHGPTLLAALDNLRAYLASL